MFDAKVTSSRRTFLATGGAVAALMATRSASAEEASAVEKASAKVVDDFCASWESLDIDKIGSFLADKATFRMIESSPRVEGREEIMNGIKGFLATAKSVKFEMVKPSIAIGNIVINERIDHFDFGDRKNAFHVAGFFFVKDGKIAEWQDYMMPAGD